MSIRRIRLMLWCSALLLGASAVVVVVAAWRLPLEEAQPPTDITQPQPSVSEAVSNIALPLSAFEPTWTMDLRRPLYDAPKPVAAPPPPPPPPPPLPVRLVGTIVEPSSKGGNAHGQAMLITARGQLEIKQVGEMVGESAANEGAKIITIEPNVVTVLYLGKEQQLKLEEQASP